MSIVTQAFRMKLYPGFAAEYKKRHDEIWPELSALLKDAGISEYRIFIDETDNSLFGVMQVADEIKTDALPSHPVMQKWWAFMSDIMASNTNQSPQSVPLTEVFYLP